MTQVKNKFILIDNEIIGGRVVFHRDLFRLHHKSYPKGGGWWYFHKEQNKLFLYGCSFDFGSLTREEVMSAELGGSFMNMKDVEVIFDSRDSLNVLDILTEHLGEEEGIRCVTECDFI